MFYPWDKCPRWLQHVFARIKKRRGGIKGVFIHGGKHIGQWAGRGTRAANVSVLALAGYDQIFICLLVPSSQSRSKNRTGTVSSSSGAPERIPAAVTRRRHPSGAKSPSGEGCDVARPVKMDDAGSTAAAAGWGGFSAFSRAAGRSSAAAAAAAITEKVGKTTLLNAPHVDRRIQGKTGAPEHTSIQFSAIQFNYVNILHLKHIYQLFKIKQN